MKPKISIILPAYNAEKYIEKSVKSILNQTEKDFELLIIDDGSTDATTSIIHSLSTSKMTLISIPHSGLIAALNKGIAEAKGKYIARMDADDISNPDRLKTQVDFLESNPDIGICGSWATIIDEQENVTGEMTYPPLHDSQIRHYARFHNPFIHSSVMIQMDIFKKTNGYRKFFRHVEDYELWTRILSFSKGANIPENLLSYRRHPHQITNTQSIPTQLRGLIVRVLVYIRLSY